ncbi:MAG: hypothetical protein M5U28_09960 [Sandaracinaceae bacterium]|nr:hypothetical protein [Sandaracinaceae bacterium]
MTEEQASLAAQIPRMARVLATGDLDGDGTQDFPALASVRVGTVSSDMGTGGYSIPTCAAADFGDDGVLRTAPRAGGACAGTYPSYAELRADDPAADVEGFVHHVSCVAEMGIGGCGFEQQLDAVLKALTPAGSPSASTPAPRATRTARTRASSARARCSPRSSSRTRTTARSRIRSSSTRRARPTRRPI